MASPVAGTNSSARIACNGWRARRRCGPRFDLIFVDPPTFSNSKRMEDVLDVQRDHVGMIRRSLKLLRPDGRLVFSTNFSRFKLDAEALEDLRDFETSAPKPSPRTSNATRGFTAVSSSSSASEAGPKRDSQVPVEALALVADHPRYPVGARVLGGTIAAGRCGARGLGAARGRKSRRCLRSSSWRRPAAGGAVLGLDLTLRDRRYGQILHLSRAGGAVHRRGFAELLEARRARLRSGRAARHRGRRLGRAASGQLERSGHGAARSIARRRP